MKPKFRVINYDLNDEVIGEYNTLEEAKQVQVDNYFFNTIIEEFKYGKWLLWHSLFQ